MTEQVTSLNHGPIIELENVHLTLGHAASSVHVLKGVSLSIAQGMSVGIVGPSGSGKSTLLMVLAGLEHIDRERSRLLVKPSAK